MTRPRIDGSTASWSEELMPAAKVTLAAPSGTRTKSSRGRLGAAAARAAMAPKPSAEPTRSRLETRPRAAHDPRRVDEDAVQADRVHDAIRSHDLHHEALARRVVHGVDRPAREDEAEDEDGGHRSGCRYRPQRQRRKRHERLGDHEE